MKKILTICNDDESRSIIKSVTEELNATSFHLPSAETALEVLKVNPDTSLVISEMELDKMDGKQLVIKMRELEHFKNIPVILTSGPIKMVEINELLTLGASYFVPKPINAEHLKAYITKILNL